MVIISDILSESYQRIWPADYYSEDDSLKQVSVVYYVKLKRPKSLNGFREVEDQPKKTTSQTDAVSGSEVTRSWKTTPELLRTEKCLSDPENLTLITT